MKKTIRLRKIMTHFAGGSGKELGWVNRGGRVRLCHGELNKLYYLPRNGKLFLCISTEQTRGAWHLTLPDNIRTTPIIGLPDDVGLLTSVQWWFASLIRPAREAWVWFENGD